MGLFLEWCGKKDTDIDVAIIGEVWRDKKGNTQFRAGYDLKAGEGRVRIYAKKELSCRVIREEDRVVIIEVGNQRIAGVYEEASWEQEEFENWLEG